MRPISPGRDRQTYWLVAPLICLGSFLVLLMVARHYETLPLHPPECGFRRLFGLPCPTCGGTRAMRALSQGHLVEAFRFHPLLVLAAFACLGWTGLAIRRYRCGELPPSPAEQNRRLGRALMGGLLLLLANWVYLLLCLK